MVDSTSQQGEAAEEVVITKLVSSASLKSPQVETWKMNSFNQEVTDSSNEFSEEILQKAEQMLQPELQRQAELLKKEAYDTAYQKGYEEGFSKGSEEGLEHGRTQGLEEQVQIFAPKLIQFDQLLEMLQAPYQKVEKQALSDLVTLGLYVAEQVIKSEISQNKEWILEAVQEAVKLLPEDVEVIKVELHPSDLALLKQLQPTMDEQWQLRENPELVLGSCLIKQQNSSVLNSWRDRFDEISEDLKSRINYSEVS